MSTIISPVDNYFYYPLEPPTLNWCVWTLWKFYSESFHFLSDIMSKVIHWKWRWVRSIAGLGNKRSMKSLRRYKNGKIGKCSFISLQYQEPIYSSWSWFLGWSPLWHNFLMKIQLFVCRCGVGKELDISGVRISPHGLCLSIFKENTAQK